ncbi:MAG: hypothetical protein IH848_07250, partial [Acidobacteria bacterium]|nr:hypothetical protein [Acidobacteriota bacterium]
MKSLDGFSRVVVADGELWIAEGFEDVAGELGLAERSRWDALIADGVSGGRGRIAFVECRGRRAALKQLRRGGVAGPL